MDQLFRTSPPVAEATSDRHKSGDEGASQGRLRIVVDLNRCQAYAQCCFLAPEVFQLHGEEALVYTPEPDDVRRGEVLRAAAACPVQAIIVEQFAGKGTR
jgi:ferredoxin